MWILAKYCHAAAPIDQQPLHAFLTNNPRGYSHSYQSHSGIYMRDMQRTTTGISADGMRGAANGSPRVRYQTVCGSRRCTSATHAAFHGAAPAGKKRTRTLISIEMANDNFSVSSQFIYDVPVMEETVSHLKTTVKVRHAGTLQRALLQPIARMRMAWYMAASTRLSPADRFIKYRHLRVHNLYVFSLAQVNVTTGLRRMSVIANVDGIRNGALSFVPMRI
ncbi:hypothetical protein ALC60_04242 [Trachymyrmex zeteki]|uniref:Uncharacterized protein n=1 Tax=Mycetomoellerius zeteki TaxID=64791 RepID=A0A151X8E9_9HYME|nr:hypothetical protein ALC60_04242 [Trachymyrmex zeteki]